jgi:hypothetical protein
MNLLLLCHGALKEFSSFTLAQGQTVQYRGNYGTGLTSGQARALVQALLDNPLVSDEEIGRQIFGYAPQEPLVGPGSFAPDISLSGDDRLLCIALNLVTRRWVQLGHDWHSTLGRVATASGQPVWIDLLCCTVLVNAEVAKAVVDPTLEVRAWADLLH